MFPALFLKACLPQGLSKSATYPRITESALSPVCGGRIAEVFASSKRFSKQGI